MPAKIKIVIADDETSYRNALQRTISLIPEAEIIALCRDGQEALDVCLATPPDVLLTDVNMPRLTGIELMNRLLRREKNVQVVVLTVQEDEETIFDCIRSGAIGYLLKTSTPQDVIDGVKLAAKGETKITPRIAAKVIEDFRRLSNGADSEPQELYELSDREQQILHLITDGMRNKDIANKLAIAEKTVKNHVSNILKALQVNSRTEAAMKAVRSAKG